MRRHPDTPNPPRLGHRGAKGTDEDQGLVGSEQISRTMAPPHQITLANQFPGIYKDPQGMGSGISDQIMAHDSDAELDLWRDLHV